MARKARNPFYTNNARTQIECEFINDDNSISRAVINKQGSDDEGEENPDWLWVHEECGVDVIEANTRQKINEIKQKETDETAKTERMIGEELFNMKLKVFELEEIRASRNTKMKSKIRRADDMMKVHLYAAALLAMELSNPAEPEPAEPPVVDAPTVPKKRAAPRKKKAPVKTKSKVRIVDIINDDKREK
jgi:hypothetical protein